MALLRHLSDTERTSDTAGYVYAVLMLLGILVKAFADIHVNDLGLYSSNEHENHMFNHDLPKGEKMNLQFLFF